MKRICSLLVLIVLAACSAPSPAPQMRYLSDSYATLYLGRRRHGHDQANPGCQAAGSRVLAGRRRLRRAIDRYRHRKAGGIFLQERPTGGNVPDFYRTGGISNSDRKFQHHSEGERSPFNALWRLCGLFRKRRRAKRGCRRGPETSGNVFSRGANAVFHEDLRWSGNARRISPRGAGLARVHPLAPPYG